MSTQTQQPQTQQPVVVYPNSVSGQAPPSHSHSDGSFGTVFIVLAVIVVISAIACFLGRLCNRRMSQTQPSKQNQKQNQNQNQNKNHTFRPKEKDIEFGFDGRIPTGKPGGHGEQSKAFKMPGNGDPRGFGPMPEHGNPTGFRMPGNGDPRGLGSVREHGNPTGFRMPGNGDPRGLGSVREHGNLTRPGNGDAAGFRMPGYGDFKDESKPFDDEALKGGA